MTDGGTTIPWGDLSDRDRERFATMLNRRFDAGVTVDEAEQYYGNPEKLERDLGADTSGAGPECPECFTSLYKSDIPHLKRTGQCPNCGATLVSGGEAGD